MEKQRYTITAALPYANGPVHIGHLAGVYIPADIYVRFLRMKNREVIFVCGSDEHGVPITLRARQEGVTPQQIVDKYHNLIKDSFQTFGISFDIYSRTSNKIHHKSSQEFFLNLEKKNVFEVKEVEQYYDEDFKMFLSDRNITGTCPRCGNPNAYGDQCESCGTTLDPVDLISPVSKLSGKKPVLKNTKHWYLPLQNFQEKLSQWILKDNGSYWKPNVVGQCRSWLDQGLQPRAVTRDIDWGVPVPVKGAEGKVLYVWFDAPIGYISATQEFFLEKGKPGEWEKFWKDENTSLIHFIGKDNIVFHCLIFPSMLMAHGDYILPDNVPANEFLNLEGDKISTSRNWAVWLHEYLNDFHGKQDVLRYVLCATAPETKDNDFTWKDFQARNNNELVANLGNFINRTLVLTEKYYSGKVPAAIPTPADKDLINEILNKVNNISASIQKFRFREALAEMIDISRSGNKYLAENEPWKLFKKDDERCKTVLNYSLKISAILSQVMEPFIPFTAKKLRGLLNLQLLSWDEISETIIKENHLVKEPELLFEKIEDAIISAQLEKLEKQKMENEKISTVPIVPESVKPAISFDDFSKLDLRIVEVLEAEKIPKTDKLLKLKINSGGEERTVVSGISKFYSPEEIIGKKVLFLSNLEPRKIKGIESKGMILMAEDLSGNLSIISPEKNAEPGSKVS